jgi:ferredoxin
MKVHVDMDLCQSHGECALLRWKEDVDESRRAVELATEAVAA